MRDDESWATAAPVPKAKPKEKAKAKTKATPCLIRNVVAALLVFTDNALAMRRQTSFVNMFGEFSIARQVPGFAGMSVFFGTQLDTISVSECNTMHHYVTQWGN